MPRMINAISDTGFPVSGTSISLHFPDLNRPTKGSWQVRVTLRRTNSDPTGALIKLLQDGDLIAQKTVPLTESFVTQTLDIPIASQYGAVGLGRCNLNDLIVEIEEVPLTCCPEPFPAQMVATLSAPGCAILDGLTIPLETFVPGFYHTGTVIKDGVQIRLAQDDAITDFGPYCPIDLEATKLSDPDCRIVASGVGPDVLICSPFYTKTVISTVGPTPCLDCDDPTYITVEITG